MSDAERVGEGEGHSSEDSASSTDTLGSEPEQHDKATEGSDLKPHDSGAVSDRNAEFAEGEIDDNGSLTGPAEESLLQSEKRTSVRQAIGQTSQEKDSGYPNSILDSMEPTLQYLSDRLIDVQENQKMLNYTLVEEWEALGGPNRQKVDYGKMILSMLRRPTLKGAGNLSNTGASASASSPEERTQNQNEQRSGSYSSPSTLQKDQPSSKEGQQNAEDSTKSIPDHPTARRLDELKQLFSQIPEYEAKLQQIRRKAAQIDAIVSKKSSETRRLKEITKQRVAEEYDKKKQDEELDQQLAAAVIDRSQAASTEAEK